MNLGIGIGPTFLATMGQRLFKQMLKLANISVDRNSSRTVMGYPEDGVVTDGQSLVTVPIGIPAITGGRLLSDNTWSLVDANGEALDASLSVQDSATNKCTCRKANPTDTSNLTLTGDANATLTVVDDSVALEAAGLAGICKGNVYKLDNSVGSANAYAVISGSSGNTNLHSISGYIRTNGGTAKITDDYTGPNALTASADYVYQHADGYTPQTTNSRATVLAEPGAIAYFILPQLEESPVATSIMFSDDLGTDSRDADIVTIPTPSVLSAESGAIEITIVTLEPSAAENRYFVSSNNGDSYFAIFIYDNSFSIRNRVSGTSIEHYSGQTLQAGDTATIQAYWDANTLGIRAVLDGVDITTKTFSTIEDTRGKVIESVLEISSKNGSYVFQGEYPLSEMKFYASAKTAGWI